MFCYVKPKQAELTKKETTERKSVRTGKWHGTTVRPVDISRDMGVAEFATAKKMNHSRLTVNASS